jgi:opacity protein-like surface antigen
MKIEFASKIVNASTTRPLLLSSLALAMAMSASSGAFAACTSTVAPANSPLAPFLTSSAAASGAAAGALAGSLGNLSTAFQTQQGSAFVSAPSDPKPDQPGGGVWVRGVGGEVTNKFSTNTVSNLSIAIVFPPFFNIQESAAANINCPGSVHESFAGVQVGQDISRLNWGGWNVHVGLTSGYLASHAFANTGGATDYEVPFFGGYLVATYGRFFADLMVRDEFYNISQTDFSIGAFGQRFGARGVSVSTSAGYNFPLPNNWFIEPSGGFIWARTSVDSFNLGNASALGIVSTDTTAPIYSEIGRLSLRAGTTLSTDNIIWQPFASASVFSEFAGNVNSTITSNLGTFTGPVACAGFICASQSSVSSTTRVGTYGQYSLGVAAQVANTGWLGFVRGDYRKGDNIEGWTANAGVRYQFTPEVIAAVMPTKAPVKAPGVFIPLTNWTGFYAGGFLGMAYGNSDIRFVGDPTNQGTNPFVMGALGGLEVGYNYEFVNKWVLGVEGDFGLTNLKGARTCGTLTGLDANGNSLPIGFNPSTMTCESAVNWMATIAARIGYSWDRTLFYVKGGGAWADDNVSATCIFGPNNGVNGVFPNSACINQAGRLTNGFSTGGTRAGWLVGIGSEFDLGHNWSAKAEYDYIGFGTHTALATDGLTTLRDSGAISQVKIGVNYRFGPQAVVANY